MSDKKIGIITWHYFPNFGSALQAYAMQYTINHLGYDAKIINFRDKRYGVNHEIKIGIQVFLHQTFSRINNNFAFPFPYFHRKYLKETKIIYNEQSLPLVSKGFDAVICGSDQIWAPNVFNPVYLLNFVPDDIPKISYAASIGLDEIPGALTQTYKKLLTSFHAISVREKQGARLLEQSCGIKSEVVLDPTLLVNIENWKKIEKEIKRKDKYIFCYFLNKNHKYKMAVESYAKSKGIEVIGCSSNPADADWMTVLKKNIGPCEFLWLIHHAETVFTDSFHGTIFSLLYHKQFVTFERFESTDKICQNSRIYQLDDYFGLSHRIIRITSDTEIKIDDFDYGIFEQRLNGLREQSMEYLKKALGV